MDATTEREEVAALARRAGFDGVGIARAGRSRHADRFLDAIARGHHGEMHYLARAVERRVDPRRTLPGACSVVVVTLAYRGDVDFPDPSDTRRGRIARYARGRDYHKVMAPRLRRLGAALCGTRWRFWSSVDTGPMLERDWAEQAGIGWIGKNGLVIDPRRGSWFFLGVVVTDRPLPASRPARDHCGTCRACLDACPTGAIVAPRRIDARRCISYLTIEKRGELSEREGASLGGWIFGCDICQEICPYNRPRRQPPAAVDPDLEPRPLPDDCRELASWDRAAFLKAFAGTPVTRARVEGLARNARWALARGRAGRAEGGGPLPPSGASSGAERAAGGEMAKGPTREDLP